MNTPETHWRFLYLAVGGLVALIFRSIGKTVYKEFLEDHLRTPLRRMRYRMAALLRGQENTALLTALLPKLPPPDRNTFLIKEAYEYSPVAIDGCFEVHHSPMYKGWTNKDIILDFNPEHSPLNTDIASLVKRFPATPPNNGKYRVHSFIPESSENDGFRITLSPTDYFSTRPVQVKLFEEVLTDDNGKPCSPFTKYANGYLLDADRCALPVITCMHVVVVLQNQYLLLTQRVVHRGNDWEAGRWSVSFEEQMNSGWGVRKPDQSFSDTVREGLKEEIGVAKTSVHEDDIRFLSFVVEGGGPVLSGIALVHLPDTVESIREYWHGRARDGKAEIRKIDQIIWSPEALAPMLFKSGVTELESTTVGPEDWHRTSRMRVLTSLLHKDGSEKTVQRLNKWYDEARTKHFLIRT